VTAGTYTDVVSSRFETQEWNVVPSTVVGVLVIVVAVLPGLVYTLAFERQAGGFGVTLADRTFRFIAVSVIFHIFAAWPEYWLYRTSLAGREEVLAGQFGLLWVALILGVCVPGLLGGRIGALYRRRSELAGWRLWLLRLVLGPSVAPRAWDNYFSERPDVYLRVRTTADTWLAGLFASRSYAAGFPQDPDLFLEQAYAVDPATGELGEPLGYPLYVAAGQIAWIEVVPPQGS
jgi:uncharacterized protein DUF6338